MTGKGAYLGTEIGGKWYRRYSAKPWFMRGNGEYRFENGTLYFRRYLTKEPLELPLSKITRITLSSWHAGRWAIGKRILQFHWPADGQELSSGFVFTRTAQEAEDLKREFERLAARYH